MMRGAGAVRLALDLMHVPSRVRYLRSEPLPEDVLTVLRIAAGDEAAEVAAAEAVGRPRGLVREASAFFIEQILLSPDADSYRVLGANPNASASELRRNMALLLKWLHPDMRRDHSMFACYVTAAWETLKTPERRAAYDRQKLSATRKARSGNGSVRSLWRARLAPGMVKAWPRKANFLRRAIWMLLHGERY